MLNYSRINVVHHAVSGADRSSNVERCAHHRRVLAGELGRQVTILELQGYLFFGTASALLDRVRERVADPDQPPARYVLLDFRRVTGLDSSAVLSFVKARQLAEAQQITLVLTHLAPPVRRQLEQAGLVADERGMRLFADLDHGLEWCEEQLLDLYRVTALHVPVTLGAQLADAGFAKANTFRLLQFLERVTVQAGDTLFRQGELADSLYFIERGSVSLVLELERGERVRLQTLGLGTAVGELGLYLGARCTASAVADTPGIAYRLSRAALARMAEEEPELAAAFHQFAARLLSERLAATTRTLEAVLR